MNRATGFALLAALLLGGYLFFFERGDRAEAPDGEPVFGIPAEAVAAVSLERPGAPPVRLERESGAGSAFADGPAADGAGGFTVREGEGPPAPADAAEVDLLLQNLESLRSGRRLPDETAADREAFGLAEPELTLRVERTPEAAAESGTAVVVVGFGAGTPAPGNRYLEVGDGVVIVPAWTKDNFDRSAWDLRDKRVFRFDTAGITGLRLRAGDEEAALEREGGEWWIVRPFRFAADSYDASRLAAKVREAEMTGLAPAEPEAPESDPGGGGARFGLAPPRLTASFTVESPSPDDNEVPDENEAPDNDAAADDNEVPGSDEAAPGSATAPGSAAAPGGGPEASIRTATIHFGGESATPPGVFARVEGDPAVFVVGQSLFDELRGSVGDRLAAVRSLRLFRFAAWKAVELRIEDPDSESVFRRRENEEGEREWVRESAAGAPTPTDPETVSEADSEAVEDLLYRLNSTDGEEIVAAPALPGPSLPGPPGARFLTITVAEEDDPYGEETSPTAGRVETVRFRTPADGPPTALREGDERALRLTGEAMAEIRLLLAALEAPSPAPAPPEAGQSAANAARIAPTVSFR